MEINQALNGATDAQKFIELLDGNGKKSGLQAETKYLGGRRFAKEGYTGTVSLSDVIRAAQHVLKDSNSTVTERIKIINTIQKLDVAGTKALSETTGATKFAHAVHKMLGSGLDVNAALRHIVHQKGPERSHDSIAHDSIGGLISTGFQVPKEIRGLARSLLTELFNESVKDAIGESDVTTTEDALVENIKQKFDAKLDENVKQLGLRKAQVEAVKSNVTKACNLDSTTLPKDKNHVHGRLGELVIQKFDVPKEIPVPRLVIKNLFRQAVREANGEVSSGKQTDFIEKIKSKFEKALKHNARNLGLSQKNIDDINVKSHGAYNKATAELSKEKRTIH